METKKIVLALTIGIVCVTFHSCKKLVDVKGPETSLSSKDIYDNDETATGSITYLYANLSGINMAGLTMPGEFSTLSCIGSLSADELVYESTLGGSSLSDYFQNSLSAMNTGGASDYWNINFTNMFSVNAALEGLTASKNLTLGVKKQLMGEARFMRAFYYFYLVNLYGDIPLVLNTDYTANALIAKSSKDKVYQQIISDLKEAQNLLNVQYVKADGISVYSTGMIERVRPTKWAATALLARTYLYLKDWSNAEMQASAILANNMMFHLESIDKVFLKNNAEAIWQLQPTRRGDNTHDATTFVLGNTGPSYNNPVYLNDELVNNFEVNDQRKVSWIGSVNANGVVYHFAYKYKVIHSSNANAPVTEYSTVMRLAEQFLIRAEARAQLEDLSGAISDVDEIRRRAGISLIKNVNPRISKSDLLALILRERKQELFTEWGHRWLDLKRTGKIDEIMSLVTPKKANGAVWKSYYQYYPIFTGELQANPNLEQVQGY